MAFAITFSYNVFKRISLISFVRSSNSESHGSKINSRSLRSIRLQKIFLERHCRIWKKILLDKIGHHMDFCVLNPSRYQQKSGDIKEMERMIDMYISVILFVFHRGHLLLMKFMVGLSSIYISLPPILFAVMSSHIFHIFLHFWSLAISSVFDSLSFHVYFLVQNHKWFIVSHLVLRLWHLAYKYISASVHTKLIISSKTYK